MTAVTATQLAAALGSTSSWCSNCKAGHVCLVHQADWPNGAPRCRACPEPLDPILWKQGLHVGCTEPAPIPTVAVAPAPASFAAPAGKRPDHPLKAELIDLIRWADSHAPRSQQTALGPSEIGVDCIRRLAYRLTNTAAANDTADPWFAIVGTAVHDWLAVAIDRWTAEIDFGPNAHHRTPDSRRFLIEERVTATTDQYGVSGSCDLYDQQRRTVVDHKVVGPTALKKYLDHGPSSQYRIQVHTYGYGHEAAGRPVDEVAIAFYPRSGYLTDLHVWSEPYDRQVAVDALNRAATIQTLATALPPALIPAVPDAAACCWCPFYRPGGPADGTGCPGPIETPATGR